MSMTEAIADDALLASRYDRMIEDLESLSIDSNRATPVEGFVFERDGAGFSLDAGTLYACNPVLGRDGFFVFEGHGRFLYRPATAFEQAQLAREKSAATLDRSFEYLFLFFGDQTAGQLTRAFPFSPADPSKKTVKFLDKARSYFPTKELSRVLLNDLQVDFLYAHLKGEETLCFLVDPLSSESVRLSEDRVKFDENWATLTSHHRPAELGLDLDENPERRDRVHFAHHDLSVEIGSGLRTKFVDDIEVNALGPDLHWISFSLDPDLEVSAASWDDGTKAGVGREEDDWTVWVEVPGAFEPAQSRKLRLEYEGDIFERTGDWIVLGSSIGWYPRTGTRRSATFDLHYEAEEKYTFISVGDKISGSVQDRKSHYHYRVTEPVRNVTFGVGHFEQEIIDDERIPPVTVHYSEKHHRQIAHNLIEEGIGSGKAMEKQVAADIANSLAFFETVLGPCPVDSLVAVETPTNHGEAFPGLINLSWATFQTGEFPEAAELFRAHEVAHQWWGAGGVDFATYHDQWLSEAFAEYSALWFLQAGLGDTETFFERLESWRDDIYGNRKYLTGSGQEAGPISLGYRNRSTDTTGDYNLIVYKKGAWVLHMLRNLLLDLDTLDESAFGSIVREFQAQYRGQKASTEDFQALVEAKVGQPMDWFFDQWVRQTGLPEYEFAWKSTPADGQHRVSVQIKQKGVGPDFRMYVPIRLDFANNQQARFRILLVGENSEFDLPLLPLEPQEIRFNDFESVLCKHKEVDWQ